MSEKKDLIKKLLGELERRDLEDLIIEKEIEITGLKDTVIELKKTAFETQHLVDFAESAYSSDDLIEMASVAKILNFKGMGRNNIFEFLRNKSILRPSSKFSRNEPYQEYVDRGYFKITEQVFEVGGYGTQINRKPMATQKGLDYIRKLLLEAGYEYNKQNTAD